MALIQSINTYFGYAYIFLAKQARLTCHRTFTKPQIKPQLNNISAALATYPHYIYNTDNADCCLQLLSRQWLSPSVPLLSTRLVPSCKQTNKQSFVYQPCFTWIFYPFFVLYHIYYIYFISHKSIFILNLKPHPFL